MRTLLFAALFLLLPVLALGEQEDKIKHASVSVVLSFSAQQAFDGTSHPMLYAQASCLAIGLAKEIYDEIDYGGFDVKDLAADAVGSLAGALLCLQLDNGPRLNLDPAQNRIQVQVPF